MGIITAVALADELPLNLHRWQVGAYFFILGKGPNPYVERMLDQDLESEPSSVKKDERPIWQIFVDSMKDVPPEILATLPKDGASQHDHYIYGWPKREE